MSAQVEMDWRLDGFPVYRMDLDNGENYHFSPGVAPGTSVFYPQ